ncbi:Proline-, glutamic acid- and leucine-rich protein 1 [Leucoagaricus sp. SymC.cos]|nr:Proline-, glutamic acid- and leucine-rich protein 1 [Leucoagaricus sp. SymC.cos]
MLENGQVWVGVALPLLSKNNPTVVLKAAIRLMKTIFARSHEISEFRRQVATPNIPKLLVALIPLVEQNGDVELKVVAMSTLTSLIPLYPTLHKPAYPALSNLALRFLDGHPHTPVSSEVLHAASRLYSVIHVTGGKVGASSLWRKTLDETLTFGMNAFWSLRTTFIGQAPTKVSIPPNEDPVTFVPLQLDRLKCTITILDDLLGATLYRPVQVPVGTIIRFALQLLRAPDNAKRDGFVDQATHVLELSVVPNIQTFGCALIVSLSERVHRHLNPHLTRIFTTLAIQVEQQSRADGRYALLHVLETLLRHYPSSHSPLIATRLMKAVLPPTSLVLGTIENSPDAGTNGSVPTKGKKGKKKAQIYEGDELFSSLRATIYPTDVEGKISLTALKVIRLLLRDPHLSDTMRSISVRVLIALLFAIPRIPPAILSPDPTLHQAILNKLHDISAEIASGTSSILSKSLPLIVAALTRSGCDESQMRLDLLLHPRLPPLMRSMPLAESLALIFSEESDEEATQRKSLGLYTDEDEIQYSVDVEMVNTTGPAAQPAKTTPVAPPKSTTFLDQQPPALARSQQSMSSSLKGKEKVTAPPESTPASVEVVPEEERQPFTLRSSAVEPPKPGACQPTPKPPRVAASGSALKASMCSAPTGPVDEDEEMPAINLDSDSEPE